MIKQKVITRSEIIEVYSSEQQERMKVYFQLTEKYNQCIDKCKLIPDNQQCAQKCEIIYNDYANILKERYEGERKELIDAKVSGLPTFDSKLRTDRGWFYKFFGQNYDEIFGKPIYGETPVD